MKAKIKASVAMENASNERDIARKIAHDYIINFPGKTIEKCKLMGTDPKNYTKEHIHKTRTISDEELKRRVVLLEENA